MIKKINFKTAFTFVLLVFYTSAAIAEKRPAPVSEPVTENIIERLDKLERILQSQGLLDMLQKLQSMESELSQLRGQVELQNHTLDQIKKRQRDIYTDLDRRIQNLQTTTQPGAVSQSGQNPPLETIPPLEDTTQHSLQTAESALEIKSENSTLTENDTNESPETSQEEDPSNTDKQTVQVDPVIIESEYQQAFNLLKQSKYDHAIKSLEKFLLDYPSSQYSDNAQYWLAEAYYVTRQYEQAVNEYSKLVNLHPESQKVTQGLLKMGYSYLELGKVDDARTVLTTLKDHYPGTTAARLAEDRLRHLEDS